MSRIRHAEPVLTDRRERPKAGRADESGARSREGRADTSRGGWLYEGGGWKQKGLTMWTTVIAYMLDFMGLITFAAGGLAFMWLIFEEVGSGRVPLRHYALVATLISSGLSMIGIAQGLRLLLLLIAKP